MTREESKSCIGTIEMLQRLAYNIHGVMDVIDADNCKKIIKALEQEPCNDAISRQAAINVAIDAVDDWDGGCNLSREEYIRKALERLRPVTPQYTDAEIQKMQDLEFAEIQKAYEIGKVEKSNKWIPVSERLPKTKIGTACVVDDYLVTVAERWKSSDEWEYHVDVATNWGTYIDDFWDTYNDWCEGQEVHIIAWMPLPGPYKQEGNNEKG